MSSNGGVPINENCLSSQSYLVALWLFLIGRVKRNAPAPSHQMELQVALAFVQLLNRINNSKVAFDAIYLCVFFRTTIQLNGKAD